MGSIRKYQGKRGVSWVIDYVAPDGKRVRQSFKTRKEAQAELTQRDYTIQVGSYTDPRKYKKFTLKQLCEQYEETHKSQQGFDTSKKYHIELIKRYFGAERLLITIKYADLELFRAYLEQTPNKFDKQRKTSTVNQILSCLRHMSLQAFIRWKVLSLSPRVVTLPSVAQISSEKFRIIPARRKPSKPVALKSAAVSCRYSGVIGLKSRVFGKAMWF